MKRYPRLAARLFETPLAIEPGRFQVLLGSIAQRLGVDVAAPELDARAFFDKEDAGDKSDPKPDPLYETVGGVAVIPVLGELVQRSSWMDAPSGLVSYERLSSALQLALGDPSVRGVLLRIDSPGGEVAGLNEFADEVYAARGSGKPVVAVSEDCACSAAYLVAAACEKFYGPQAGAIGNIGVIVSHVDTSAADAKRGVKITRFYGGARKGDGWEPINSDSAKAYQQRAQELYDLFTAKVAQFRGVDQQAVRDTEAAYFVGSRAVELGLMDAVKPFTQVLGDLQAAVSRRDYPSGYRGAFATAKEEGSAMDLKMLEVEVARLRAENAENAAKVLALETSKAELAAQVKAFEIREVNEAKRKREAVFEKHALRLSPATMTDMRASLEKVADCEKVDGILAKLPDEVNPTAPAPATLPVTAAVDPKDAYAQLQAKATALRSTNPKLSKFDAFVEACKQNPDLYRAHREKHSSLHTRN